MRLSISFCQSPTLCWPFFQFKNNRRWNSNYNCADLRGFIAITQLIQSMMVCTIHVLSVFGSHVAEGVQRQHNTNKNQNYCVEIKQIGRKHRINWSWIMCQFFTSKRTVQICTNDRHISNWQIFDWIPAKFNVCDTFCGSSSDNKSETQCFSNYILESVDNGGSWTKDWRFLMK